MTVLQRRLFLLLMVAALFAAMVFFDVSRYVNLEYFATQRDALDAYTREHFVLAAASYFFLYLLVFALALPVGAALTLIGGAIFGLWWAVLLVSFASSLGSLLAFLAARYIAHDWVNRRYATRLAAINRGIEKEGAFYLFTLRLVPLFPPALINVAMGLSAMRAWPFYWVSQLGMLAGTVVYVNAGTQLANIDSSTEILSPPLIIAFALLGVFPLIAKRVLDALRRQRVYRPYKRPRQYDTNIVVIGAGSGGLVAAYIAAIVKAKVTLIEKNKMGGDCLNTGCVPSKALIHAANVAHKAANAEQLGVLTGSVRIDFSAVMGHVRNAIKQIEPHDSIERYSALGVDCVQGEATIVDPYRVRVGGRTITTRNIVIATGGQPAIPDIAGLGAIDYYTSDSIWTLTELPQHLLIIGGGPIGCELAQAFRRLGSEVTIISRASQLLPKEDADIAGYIQRRFSDEGINVCLRHQPRRASALARDVVLDVRSDGGDRGIRGTHLLLATGRRANTRGLGLQALGIDTARNGTIEVDAYLRTRLPNIYAVGDVAGPYQFTHAASHQAWYAVVNSLLGGLKKFKADYRALPWVTFTDPEVARVGLSESDAESASIAFEVTRYDLSGLDRAVTEASNYGVVKLITAGDSDRLLGATIVGPRAGELIGAFASLLKRRGRLKEIMGVVHAYPTLLEANKYAAGEWRKAHKPERMLAIAERIHCWRRGD